jgi:phenylpropionate dioxygenase-like ring-hydroxylating dioxygenase large terminal subunit
VGDRVAVTVGRAPIVVVRAEGGLRAFHDICRHRGMIVAGSDGSSCGETLRCPYHGWEWDLDGRLVRVPQRRTQFPDLDPGALGLHPASVAEWEGMVFVHPDHPVPPFADARAGLDTHLGSFRPGRLPKVARVRIEADLNWKLFVENHIDVYHLWYLHDRSLAEFDHTRFQHQAVGRNWASYEPMRDGGGDVGDGGEGGDSGDGLVPIRHLAERDRRGIQAHMLFPNTLMAASASYFATYAVHPITPGRSFVDLRVRAEPDVDVDRLVASIRAFIDEDVRACEQIQRALPAARFAVGPLARTHERPIETFQTNLLEALDR